MNHLCGLTNLQDQGNNALPSNLTDAGREALNEFRERYESALNREITNAKKDNGSNDNGSTHDSNNDRDADEEKKESSNHQVSEETSAGAGAETIKATAAKTKTIMVPAYEVSPDQLPPSGLRPLDDDTLYRYLLADRQGDGTFNVESSYQRLLLALKFRKDYKCDAIVQNVNMEAKTTTSASTSAIPPLILKGRRMRVAIWAGVDHQSRPVVFERLGQLFSSGNGSAMPPEDWLTCYLYFLETHFCKMRQSAIRSKKPVDRIVYFADFQGVVSGILNRKIWKVVPLLKTLTKSVECHYPEIVDHIVLFNVPRVASAFYNFCKGFTDPVTAEKIELFAGVPYDRFRELMSDDVIPVEYRGKNKIEYPQTAKE